MKKLLLLLTIMLVGVSCSEYDDSAIWDKLNNFENRLQELEKKVASINDNTLSLSKIIESLQERKYVTDITYDDNGYTINFSDGESIKIQNGKDGVNAPIIGVKKDTDGKYYWTQTIEGETTWLIDPNSNQKIPASGTTPIIKVDENGFWIISYDNGATYQQVLDENENPIKAVGKDGDSMFTSVKIEGNFLIITLASGEIISLPIETEPYVSYDNAVDLGLSVKWAKFNIGASDEYEKGDLFAWGELETKEEYTQDNYLYYDKFHSKYTLPLDDISGTKYDVARAKWGGRWRMPTYKEILELQSLCEIQGNYGYDTYVGNNGNSIIIPFNRKVNSSTLAPFYWSSTRHEENTAYCLPFSHSTVQYFNVFVYLDCGIRPVLDK